MIQIQDDELNAARAEAQTDQFIERELLGTGHFNRAIHRLPHGDAGDRPRDVIRRHRLNQYVWEPDRRSFSGVIGDPLDEFEELRRVNDRIRDPAALDQRFLSVLRAQIAAIGYPRCSDYGQRDVMPHTGSCRVLEDVPRRRGEELHDGRVLEGRRIRDVDDDRRPLKDVGQAPRGERVDAGIWRCGHGLMALLPQSGHEL